MRVLSRVAAWIVFALASASAALAQQGVDFSGRWILVSPSPAPVDVAAAMSVTQPVVRTSPSGTPIPPVYMRLTIEREVGERATTEERFIGADGGDVAFTAEGVTRRRDISVRWDGDALTFDVGSYTGPRRQTGEWREQHEIWSLDGDGRLRVRQETQGSAEAPRTIEATYRRR